jgi:hypothetical protein
MSNERFAMFNAEYYDAADAEESDPDPAFETTGDNTDDLETELANALNVGNIVMKWIDRDGDADRYRVTNTSNNELGVAYISIDYVKES